MYPPQEVTELRLESSFGMVADKRRRRKTAVTPEMVKDLEEFLALPTVSRSCPGKTVSVAYGKTKPKHRMSCSKEAALLEFNTTQSSHFSVTTLLKFWPKQFVIPSSNDQQPCHHLCQEASGGAQQADTRQHC